MIATGRTQVTASGFGKSARFETERKIISINKKSRTEIALRPALICVQRLNIRPVNRRLAGRSR